MATNGVFEIKKTAFYPKRNHQTANEFFGVTQKEQGLIKHRIERCEDEIERIKVILDSAGIYD